MYLLTFSCFYTTAQDKAADDTFFLAKKKGILGRLGKSIAHNPAQEPENISNPYLKFEGYTIRKVEIFPLHYTQRFDDTTIAKQNALGRIGTSLHTLTRERVIRKNLFFKPLDKLSPFQISDNEKFLREQNFLQDARIVVLDAEGDSVDVVVFTRDVFSIGGSINANSVTNVRTDIRDENIAGTGNLVSVSTLYDSERFPAVGTAVQVGLRNIKNTFVNWNAGYKSFGRSLSSGRFEENSLFTGLEKPLVSRYTEWTGAINLSYNKSINGYLDDSTYRSSLQYAYNSVDLWGGYNFGSRNKKIGDSDHRLRHFVAGRSFYTYFDLIPAIYDSIYNPGYANINGVLFSYTLYKQNFYRTNFIYGFGRHEDLPVGFSSSLVGGWANKENVKRFYLGLELEGSMFTRKTKFRTYKLRVGGYRSNGKFEDMDLLLSVDHISHTRRINKNWLSRRFISFSFSKLINPFLSQPLLLQSEFGLPYFVNGTISADERTTIKLESVYFNLKRILGFRFAPFLFGDVSLLRPVNELFIKSDLYSALGAGLRARNESLIFGTIELRGFYFPRVNTGMEHWKVDVSTKLRFKYNSSFIRKPSFINVN